MEQDRGREDFLTEAQDIVESFSQNLLAIDAGYKRGHFDPSLINEAFRAIHTLKGLAGLFGATSLGMLTHRLEDLLDSLRLGRTDLDSSVLDVLFAAVEGCHELIAIERSGEEDPRLGSSVVGRLLGALDGVSASALSLEEHSYEIDPTILAVLTEYEEHRLRANLDGGSSLFRLRARFDLLTIDKDLSALKDKARQLGEVITYLPTGEATAPEILELDLILASGEELATLIGQLGSDVVIVEEIPRGGGGTRPASLRIGAGGGPPSLIQPSSSAPVSSGRAPAALEPKMQEKRLSRRAVRVDIHKLDRLMNVVGELSLLRGSLRKLSERVRQSGDRQLGGELQRLNRSFERRLEDMQDGILEMRMVPLGQVFDRLARGVRQVSRDLDKEVSLVITGAETEIDKLIVEELGDPLLHMLRNAIDHGIESADERLRAKKSPVGTIALNAYQKGNHVMIEVEDDGRGIDERRLLERAIELGAVERQTSGDWTREQLLALMFLPGLTTRDAVSETSGRGVGMDVVKTNISRLGGVIDVQSERGIGTKMTLTLPITLAIVRALLVDCLGQTYAIALSSVSEVISLDARTRMIDGREVMTLRGSTLTLCRLSEYFGLVGRASSQRRFVVVAQVGERRLGLVVDGVFGQQDIVIKSLGNSLAGVSGFSGATELGDQRVGLVLDTAAIVEEATSAFDAKKIQVLHG